VCLLLDFVKNAYAFLHAWPSEASCRSPVCLRNHAKFEFLGSVGGSNADQKGNEAPKRVQKNVPTSYLVEGGLHIHEKRFGSVISSLLILTFCQEVTRHIDTSETGTEKD
jgi:hypothetical protein